MCGLKEKDKLTERAAGSSGIEEKGGRGRLLFTLHRSRRLTGFVPSTKNRGEERTEKRRRTEGRKKIELTVYHTARAKSIERKLLSCSSEYDIK